MEKTEKNPKICLEFVQAHNFQDPKILGGKPTKNTPIWFLNVSYTWFSPKESCFFIENHDFSIKKTWFSHEKPRCSPGKAMIFPWKPDPGLSSSPTGQPTPSLPACWPRRSSPRASVGADFCWAIFVGNARFTLWQCV